MMARIIRIGLALAAALMVVFLAAPTHAEPGDIRTVAGGGVGDGGDAELAVFLSPAGIALDSRENVYVADSEAHRVRKIDAITGTVSTVAGVGVQGFSGDGGSAVTAMLNSPFGIAIDRNDNLYIADSSNQRIRKVILANGLITTVAGSGNFGFQGDGGPAVNATFMAPRGVAVDESGNLFIADTFGNRIRKVDGVTGTVTTFAGNGSSDFTGDFGPAHEASFLQPEDVAVDRQGNVFIADTGNHRIRKVLAGTGLIITFAGDGESRYAGDSGQARNASLFQPRSIAIDRDGNLYIADTNNHRIRKVDIFVENIFHEGGDGFARFGGDGRSAFEASLDSPAGIAVNATGDILVSDTGNRRVRRVASSNLIETIAGNGESTYSGDTGAALDATVFHPHDVVVDTVGNIYFSDTDNHRVRRVNAGTGIIETVAGNGTPGFSGDGRQGIHAQLRLPEGLALDSAGHLYIADRANHRVRRLDAGTGIMSTVAGDGSSTYNGDNIPAIDASLREPKGLAIDTTDNLYIADSVNNRIRMVSAGDNRISTVAGSGVPGFGGDQSLANRANLQTPQGVAVDRDGNIFIADTGNNRIRRVDVNTMRISTIAGTGAFGFAGDGGPATTAIMGSPRRVAVDASGNVFISDDGNNRIRVVKPDGTIITVAGNGVNSFSGDGGAAQSATIHRPIGITLDSGGSLYFADSNNNRIRVIEAPVVEEPTPTPSPTFTATATPTPSPTGTPTPRPTTTPTPIPTFTPTVTPSPTFTATATPTPSPTGTPTPSPTTTPTPVPRSLPDLVPGRVSLEVENPVSCMTPNYTIRIKYTVMITNQGSENAGPFVVEANGVGRATVPGLGAGNSIILEVPGLRAFDNTVIVDVESQVEESDETNNVTESFVPALTPPPICTPTPSPTPTVTPTFTPTATPTPTFTPTGTPTPTFTPTNTATPRPTDTPTPLPTDTPTPVPPPATATDTPTVLPTRTATPKLTPTTVPSPTVTPTETPVVQPTVQTIPPPVNDSEPNPVAVIVGLGVVVVVAGVGVGAYTLYRRRYFGA